MPDKFARVYVGTYNLTPEKTERHPGIYVFNFYFGTGRLEQAGEVPGASNPSFLCLSGDCNFLYATYELAEDGQPRGGVASFAINEQTGIPVHRNTRPTGGGNPCHVTLDRRGQWLFASNYRDGSFAIFPIESDGSIGERSAFVRHSGSGRDPKRQDGPHVHSCAVDPSNLRLLVADLGIDRVAVYDFDAELGAVRSRPELWIAARPGAGPRHMAFHNNAEFFYVVNELDSTVAAFRNEDGGRLSEIHTVPMLPSDFNGFNTAADIHIHPSGRFLYASNRGHDSIAICSIENQTGRLKLLGHEFTLGKEPRNFALEPGGRYLLAANQRGNNIAVFKLDPETGLLKATGEQVAVPTPTCVLFGKSEC